jgi:hypothetical protein
MAAYAMQRGWSLVMMVEDVSSGASERWQREALLRAARRRDIEAITRYIPVKEHSGHPERARIFLMGPAASEDRFECVHTFQALHERIMQALGS